jgi:hypothetical protein
LESACQHSRGNTSESCLAKAADQLDLEAVTRLPIVDATSDGQHALPTVEQRVVAPDYLDFLPEQIRLNPRGPEWLALLKNRLAKIFSFLSAYSAYFVVKTSFRLGCRGSAALASISCPY